MKTDAPCHLGPQRGQMGAASCPNRRRGVRGWAVCALPQPIFLGLLQRLHRSGTVAGMGPQTPSKLRAFLSFFLAPFCASRQRSGAGGLCRLAGTGSRARTCKNLVQLRLIPMQRHCTRPRERELQQGGGQCALRHNREQAGPPHYPCRAQRSAKLRGRRRHGALRSVGASLQPQPRSGHRLQPQRPPSGSGRCAQAQGTSGGVCVGQRHRQPGLDARLLPGGGHQTAIGSRGGHCSSKPVVLKAFLPWQRPEQYQQYPWSAGHHSQRPTSHSDGNLFQRHHSVESQNTCALVVITNQTRIHQIPTEAFRRDRDADCIIWVAHSSVTQQQLRFAARVRVALEADPNATLVSLSSAVRTTPSLEPRF